MLQVRLTHNAFFIQSPGGLRGVSLAQLVSTEHAQATVNQHLYAVSKKLRTATGDPVIEGEGGGIREVFRSAADRGLPRPRLIDSGVQFKALLWRPGTSTHPVDERRGGTPAQLDFTLGPRPRTRNARVVLSAFDRSASLTLHELTEATELNAAQVRYALTAPIAAGEVIMEGGQGVRGTRYRLERGPRSEA